MTEIHKDLYNSIWLTINYKMELVTFRDVLDDFIKKRPEEARKLNKILELAQSEETSDLAEELLLSNYMKLKEDARNNENARNKREKKSKN